MVRVLEKYNRECRERDTTNKESEREMSRDYMQRVALAIFPDLQLLTSEQTDELMQLSLLSDPTPSQTARYGILITQYGRYEDAVACINAMQNTWNGRKLVSRLVQGSITVKK